MITRLIRWFSLNVFFALTPIIFVIIIRYSVDKLTFEDIQNNSLEIMFFAFTISITTIADIDEFESKYRGFPVISNSKWFFIIVSIWISIIYGTILYESITSINSSPFRYRMFYLACILSIVIFTVGLLIQVYISWLIQKSSTIKSTRKLKTP